VFRCDPRSHMFSPLRSNLRVRRVVPRVLATRNPSTLVIDAVGWQSMHLVVMPRVNLIVILSTYARYVYSINCPTIICLPSMSLFILWRDTTSELWTPVQFPLYCYHLFTLLALFTFSHTTIAFHSILSFLCLQQTGEIDNLIVSWEQSSWLCCVQVLRCY
jgi:hypothetical protein